MINSNRNSCRGFTLVELLVVIGIISILAAIALPAFNVAIRQARKAKCSSNLRQIGAALITSATDNSGNFPEAGNDPTYNNIDTGGSGKYGWTQQLEPYLGTGSAQEDPSGNSIYQCPDRGLVLNNKYYSYFLGAHAAGGGNGDYAPVNIMRIKAPSAHIIAGDINAGFELNDCDKDDYGANDPAFNGYTAAQAAAGAKSPILIHGGSVNLVFADGHVQNARSYDNTNMTTHYAGVVNESYTQFP